MAGHAVTRMTLIDIAACPLVLSRNAGERWLTGVSQIPVGAEQLTPDRG
jgi:hypothetical protein